MKKEIFYVAHNVNGEVVKEGVLGVRIDDDFAYTAQSDSECARTKLSGVTHCHTGVKMAYNITSLDNARRVVARWRTLDVDWGTEDLESMQSQARRSEAFAAAQNYDGSQKKKREERLEGLAYVLSTPTWKGSAVEALTAHPRGYKYRLKHTSGAVALLY